ncbi:hypothetical protein KY348_03460 [Candidatus Woesearchaeota archaeon]|nr:hypothetical protein [Candidatus Woesearchaeota archaeon]
MNKLVVVAIALLVCALVLGVGGVLLAHDNAGVMTEMDFAESTSFCDPVVDPGCHGGSWFCDPVVDPGCHGGG